MSTVRILNYRNCLDELGRIAEDVCAYCREHGVDPDTALALTLCLTELFTNSIKYAYPKPPQCGAGTGGSRDGALTAPREAAAAPAPRAAEALAAAKVPAASADGLAPAAARRVEVRLRRMDDRVEVCYSDDGAPFDPSGQLPEAPDLDVPAENLPTGGFGLYLLRQLSSQIAYSRNGSRNQVQLSFIWR